MRQIRNHGGELEGGPVPGGEDIARAGEAIESAAKKAGIEPEGPLGIFVEALRWAVLKLGEMVVRIEQILPGRLEAFQSALENMRKLSEAEVAKAQGLAELELQKLREYNRAAAYSIAQAEAAKELVITRVADGLSLNLTNRLIDGSRDFLVLKETAYNRRQAWKLASIVSVCMLLVFGVGYELRAFQDDPVTSGVARCVDRQLMGSLNGKFVPICTVKDLTAQRAGSLGERLMAYFWYGGLDYADMAKAGKS